MTNPIVPKLLFGLAFVISFTFARSSLDAFREDEFWLSYELQAINWTEIINDELPFLNDEEGDIILNDALFESVNPLIIISLLATEHKSQAHPVHQKVPEFSTTVESSVSSLVDAYMDYEDKNATVKTNVATSAIWEILDRDDDKLKLFLETFNELYSAQIEPFTTPFKEEDRVGGDSFKLTWPWPNGKSWKVGGTHGYRGVWSDLDPQDGLQSCRWNADTGDTGCKEESVPLVYAMHSGVVSGVTKCNIRITHPSGWATQYYHMDDIKFKNGDNVEADQAIGVYAGDYETALCNRGRTTGPHLHLSLINAKTGRKESLDGKMISGYKIKTGTEAYDTNCDRCNYQKDGKTYCPWDSLLRDDTYHTCQQDSDCQTKLSCRNGYCKECAKHEHCPNGKYCNDGGKCEEMCCDEIIIASTGLASNRQKHAIGDFTKAGFRNGKMAYKNRNDRYLSFHQNNWMIQSKSNFDKGNGWRYIDTKCHENCPTKCKGPWRVWNSEWVDDSTINVSCVSKGEYFLLGFKMILRANLIIV